MTTQNSKFQVLVNFFIFGRLGVILDYSKLKVPNSGQLFIWGGGGRVFLTTQNLKCQVPVNFSFLGDGGEGIS